MGRESRRRPLCLREDRDAEKPQGEEKTAAPEMPNQTNSLLKVYALKPAYPRESRKLDEDAEP